MPPVKVRPLLRGASRNHAMWQNGPRTCPLRPGFVVATDPKCQFGGEDSMIVNATVRSANLMQCWSPINDEKDGGIPWSRLGNRSSSIFMSWGHALVKLGESLYISI